MVRIEYRSFFIRMAKTGLWWIEKDGKCFMAVDHEAHARQVIDRIVGPL